MAGWTGLFIVSIVLGLAFIDPVTSDDTSDRLLSLMKSFMEKQGKGLDTIKDMEQDLKATALFADLDLMALDRVLATLADFNKEAVVRCVEAAFLVETKDVHESIFIQAAFKAKYSDIQHCDGFRMGAHLVNLRKLFPVDYHACDFLTLNVTSQKAGSKDGPYAMEVYADTWFGRMEAVGDMDQIGTHMKEVAIPAEQKTYSCEMTMTALTLRRLLAELNQLGKDFTISCTPQHMNFTVVGTFGTHNFLLKNSARKQFEAQLSGEVPPRTFMTAKVYSSTRVESVSASVTLRLAPAGPLVLHYQLKKDADGLLKHHSHITFFMDSME